MLGRGALALMLTMAAAGPAAAQSFPPAGLAKPLSAGSASPAGSVDRGAMPVPYARYVSDEVLVRFREGVGGGRRSAALAAVGAKLDRVLPVPGLRTVKLPAGTSVDEAVRRFEADPRVLYAEPNHRVRNNATTNDPGLSSQWGLHNTGQYVKGFVGGSDRDIDAPEAWDLTIGSSDVVVGHIDGGVALNHPDLAGNLWTNAAEVAGGRPDDDGNGYVDDLWGWDWASSANTSQTSCAVGDNDPSDDHGHGTHTAGTIGAYGNNGLGVTGVAQRVRIMPLRVTDRSGFGEVDDIICAFRYAANKGVKVVNASVGADFISQAMQNAVAGAPNTLLVTTAGNDAKDVDVANWWPCNLPADNVLCVGATDANDNLWTDSDGFWASKSGAGSNYGDVNVDLSAPGVFISSTSPFRSIFRDTFDDRNFAGTWTTGGTGENFGIEYPPSGPRDGFTLSDSEGGNYLDDADPSADNDPWAQAPGRSTRGMSGCQVRMRLVAIETEAAVNDPDGDGPEPPATIYDHLAMDLSRGGGTWAKDVGKYFTPTSKPGSRTLQLGPEYSNQAELWLRFRFHSDHSVTRNGAHVDDLDVQCLPDNRSYDATSYVPMSGTSMAAPHVTGVAALMLAARADLTVPLIKQTLMETGDWISLHSGKTVSGRRLNAFNAVAKIKAPNTEITAQPSSPTSSTAATFSFSTSQPTSSGGFECRIDGQFDYRACTSGETFWLPSASATYTFRVRARNHMGTADTSPATSTWTVDKTGPNTFVDASRTPNPTGYTNARFSFAASEDAVTYECRLDSGGWEACTSPKAYPATASGTPLAPGTHTFSVQALDKLGNPDPTPAGYTWTIAAPAAERNPAIDGWSAGASVRGDFDGDGFDDLAVGVPGEDIGTAADAGAVHVLYGTATGLSGTRSWFVHQDAPSVGDVAEPSDGFGASLAVGDFDGDGRSDLAVGAPAEDGAAPDAGTVQVFRGSPTGLGTDGQQQWTQATAASGEPAEAADQFGATLAAGDTTGDGRAELVVGAPGEDLPNATDAGAVHLLPGGASGPLGGTGGRVITQATPNVAEDAGNADRLGAAMALGDFDGDGKADLALAAPGEQVGTIAQAGAVHVLAGAAGGFTTAGSKLFHQDTAYVGDVAEAGDHFGAALAAGDFGGSSSDELAIGVPDEDRAAGIPDAGAVQVLAGASPGLLTTTGSRFWFEDVPYVVDTCEDGDRFGAALAVGDFGGSAHRELAIGVPGEDVGFAPDAGAVSVLAGSAGGLVTTGNRLWTQDSGYVGETAEPGDHFGAALAAGDFGDEAQDDLVIGVPDESQGTAETRGVIAAAGAVHRLAGASAGLKALDSQLLTQATYGVADAPEAGDGFGAAVGR